MGCELSFREGFDRADLASAADLSAVGAGDFAYFSRFMLPERAPAPPIGRAETGLIAVRPPLPFRAVNRPDRPGHDPGFQRHHLLPRQLLSARGLGTFLGSIGPSRIGFDDFRRNGLLLPASDRAALRFGLPLHRGPHRDYNALVIERVGEIEAGWARQRRRTPEAAAADAVRRLGALQQALRQELLSPSNRRWRLNRHDPVEDKQDFSEIDALIDDLWPATAVASGAVPWAPAGAPAGVKGAVAAPVAGRAPVPRGEDHRN